MKRPLQLLIVLALGYFAVSKGFPWVIERVEGISEDKLVGTEHRGAGRVGQCLGAADDTFRFIRSELGTISPAEQAEEWGDAEHEIGAMIEDARATCGCTNPVCETSSTALEEMAALVASIERAVTSGRDYASAFNRRSDRIDELLFQAKAHLDRQLEM